MERGTFVRFVIVSGLSGAGKSQVVNCMEDVGFYCIDNIPPVLIPKIAQVCMQSKIEKLALVTDLRGKEMFNEINNAIAELKDLHFDFEILFLEANNEVLVKRFKETRRKHPLVNENSTVLEAINKERRKLEELRGMANNIIDTSNLTANQLKEQIKAVYMNGEKYEGIVTHIISFGFKYGMPLDADLVFDVRFLPNPYYIKDLKEYNGLSKQVRDFVFAYEQTNTFVDKLTDMIEFLYPYYIEEGKSQLVIAIGCTGGMHRSVAIAKELHDRLHASGHNMFLGHRDIERDGKNRIQDEGR